jgi:hypothetical protein
MNTLDEEIANAFAPVTLLIDGWTSRNIKGYIAVFISFPSKRKNGPKIDQKLLGIIPTLSHSSKEVFEDMKNHIFSKIGDGNYLPGAGSDPKREIAIVCNHASANTSLVERKNVWLSKL